MTLNKIIISVITLVFLFTLTCSNIAWAEELEMPAGQHFSLVNEQNAIVHQTGLQVYPGDIYIAPDNSKYLVVEVNNSTARCIYQGKETMPEIADEPQTQANAIDNIAVLAKTNKPTIAVYHTHSDESYVPSDGKESINGRGGIYDVGDAFVKELEKLGFTVDYNKENHNPHDINAYNRSRKTVVGLLKKVPVAIIDVHRDAVPPGEYQAKVNGQDVTKVKLVVGRTNPNMKTTMEFAKNLKAAMDKKTPGLSDGIFIGKGSYNQDLSPRAMLIEVGAHTNDKIAAEKGVKLFAGILPTVLGITPSGTGTDGAQPAQKPFSNSNQNSGSTILIILVVVAAAVGGFFLLNKGSMSK